MAQLSDSMANVDESMLLTRLRDGDESAFSLLIDQYQRSMIRVALMYVQEREIAEEVVQETWIAVLKGLPQFEGRSSLKTWLFSILTNRAKTRAQRENRYVPLPTFEDDDPTVEPERFQHPLAPGHWSSYPDDWNDVPETQLLSQETSQIIQRTIDSLPTNQRTVITLRDIDGWSSEEVCNTLSISETNQRVLLHRARAVVRRQLEHYLDKI